MADDDKTRWALDVMTAWVDHEHDGDFVHARVASYLSEPDGTSGLTTGLINLSGLLLMGMEATIGKSPHEILQTIAVTLSRHAEPPTQPLKQGGRGSNPRPSEATTHSFRKTAATLIDDEGVSARIGADQHGHSHVSMTQDRSMSRGRVHTQVAELLDRAVSDGGQSLPK